MISDTILSQDHPTHCFKKKDFSCGFKYRKTQETRTLKGNEKQFELQLELKRIGVNGVDCKIQFDSVDSKLIQIHITDTLCLLIDKLWVKNFARDKGCYRLAKRR